MSSLQHLDRILNGELLLLVQIYNLWSEAIPVASRRISKVLPLWIHHKGVQ